MGFKYKKFSFTTGSTEFPTGLNAANTRTREEYLVSHTAQAIIDCDCGWTLDTSRNETTTNFFAVKKRNSSTDAPGLFLVNSTSGCKLFLSYLSDNNSGGLAFLDTDGTTKVFKDEFVSTIYHKSRISNSTSIQGMIMSMIPSGSSNDFGSICDVSFLPADATRFYGSASNVANSNSKYTLGDFDSSNIVITLQVFATPYCIGAGASVSPTGSTIPWYFCGRIMGDLASSSDNSKQSKYGTFTFRRSKASDSSSYDYISDYSNTQYNYGNCWVMDKTGSDYFGASAIGVAPGGQISYSITYESSSPYREAPFAGNCVCKADGSWIANTSSHGVAACVNRMLIFTEAVFDATSNSRPWQPIAICVFSNDIGTDGIVSGVGLKGYLDTDLFRCSPQFSTGVTMDNGNFVCTGMYGLTLGWDPTNESW